MTPPSTSGRGAASIRIVPLAKRHLRAVMRIESVVYPMPWSRELYLSELSFRSGRTYRAALSGSDLVGYGGIMHVAGEAHVTTLAVRPDQQGSGIGTQILLALARAARADGMTSLTLEVRAGNEPAQALYRRFGLAPAGIRRGYYRATGEDAVIMWAEEIDTPSYGERLDAIEQRLTIQSSGGRP